MTLKAKVRPGMIFGDLRIIQRSDEKLQNGTYRYITVCVVCGRQQNRGYQNLLASKHSRCHFCPGTSEVLKESSYPAAVIVIRSGPDYLVLQGENLTRALDAANPKVLRTLFSKPCDIVFTNSGQVTQAIADTRPQALLQQLTLRLQFTEAERLDPDLQYDLPKPPQAVLEEATKEESYQPIHEPYELVKRSHFKFFDWEREAPVGEQLPPEIAQLVDKFEKTYGDITEWNFSASPADAGSVYIYWTRPS